MAYSREDIRTVLSHVYDALEVKGYDPIAQLIGYLYFDDPKYITPYNQARTLISRLDRDEIMVEVLKSFLGKE